MTAIAPSGASIRRDALVETSAEQAWDAISDFAAVHIRVAPGFLTDLKMEGPDRVVTFSNGAVATEVLVASDHDARRLVYAIPKGPFVSYSAAFQVFEEGPGRCRVTWIVDLVPASFAEYVGGQMDLAVPIMQRTLAA